MPKRRKKKPQLVPITSMAQVDDLTNSAMQEHFAARRRLGIWGGLGDNRKLREETRAAFAAQLVKGPQ